MKFLGPIGQFGSNAVAELGNNFVFGAAITSIVHARVITGKSVIAYQKNVHKRNILG